MGNVLRNAQAPSGVPVLYYIGKGILRVDVRKSESWRVQLGERVQDTEGCQLRIQKVQDNPGYDLSGNHGEEFVNYVVTARKESSLDNSAELILRRLAKMEAFKTR